MRLIDADKLIYQSHAQHLEPYINKKDIDDAPTVEMAEDCVSREDALIAIINLFPDIPRVDFMDAKRKWAEKYAPYLECKKAIEDLPSVQPQPKRGKWIEHEEEMCCICSVCGTENWNAPLGNFCPNCGADMREVQDER